MSARQHDFLSGGGEMGALMRAKDWSATPLGPVESWPQSLRSAVSILLPSRAQIALFWGPDLITLYNDAYRPVFGGKHPQALGQPIRESWAELWRAGLKELFEAVLSTGEAYWAKERPFYMERHGFLEETYFDVSYDPVRDESGRVGGVFCIVSEQTGRVLGERRLKVLRDLAAVPSETRGVAETLERSLAVLAASPADIASCEIDLDGSRLWALGAGRDRMVLPLLVPGADAAKIALEFSPRLRFDEEYRTFFNLVAAQIGASLSSARAVEEERRRAEALAEIDRAKTAFFGNVSHEFRTPLTLMLGPIEDALAEAAAPLPAAQRERLELAHRSALRLQKLVNTLLDFSRIEAGRMQASYEPTGLAALTADLASSFRSAVEKAGLTLSVDCPALSAPAYVDRDMWEKIVLNLVSNAFKFTFEGGIRVRLREAGGRIELEVRDTGVGIPAAELPRLFERFRRVEGARSRTHEGTGIGLALVKELVALHGGTIRVESDEGRGSAFIVSIPAGKAHLPADRVAAVPAALAATAGARAFTEEALRWLPSLPAQAPEGGGKRARIVWADDNADLREYVAKLLSPHYDVQAVADGEAALEAVRARMPDLVLADVMMPGLDGFGLLARLRADERTRSLPVVLLSARAGEEARVEGLQAGADDYIAKPFSARELLARIASRLELSRMAERLRLEQADFDRLFAQVPVPTAVLRGPDLVFETCNAAYIEAVGGRDIVGRPLAQALPELRGQGFDELLRRVMRTGEPHVGRETPVQVLRNGKLVDAHFTFIYAPLRSADGAVERVIAVCNEVTEQVAARRKIEALAADAREAAQELEDFVENATIAMHWVGPDGSILWANRAELEMLGYAREEYVGRNIADFHADPAAIRDILQRLHRDETLSSYEATLVRKDGALRHVLIDASVRWQDGRFLHTQCFTRDVTERKVAEQALTRREAELRAIVEGTPECVKVVARDGTLLQMNRSGLAMVGAPSAGAVLGRSIYEVIAGEDRERFRAFNERVCRGESGTLEFDIVALDGRRRHMETHAVPLPQEDGSVAQLAVTRDVTDRTDAQDALRRSEARYRDIFESAGVSIWEEDFTAVLAFIGLLKKQGVRDFRAHFEAHPEIVREAIPLVRVVDVNEASLRLFGAVRKDELLESLDRVFTPETEAVFREEMVALAEGRRHFEGEARMRALDGRPLDVLVHITFPGEGRDPEQVLVTLTDITARKSAERRLQRELAAARSLQETSVQLLEHEDPATLYRMICDAAVEIMGSQFASMQMLHPERGASGELRLLAMHGFDAQSARFWEWVRADSNCTCGAALRSGQRVIVTDVEKADFMAGTDDQRALLAAGIRAAQSTPLVARDGTLLGMITTHWRHPHAPADHELRLMDVLARQASDLIERSKAMQALRDADQRKDEFLAILSHELRNPLAPIRNAVSVLRGAGDDPALRGEALPILDRQVGHLVRLVDDLLDVARINRGDVTLQKRVVTLAEVVAAALEASRPGIEARRHRLVVDVSPAPAAVLGDPVRLAQVVSNVLNNAATYTPEGGRIDVVARAENGRAVIRVRDTGPGIPPETARSIFDLFIRGESARNHPAGFGIGLALARRLVEMHDGTIEVSSPGAGSEFVIRLPLEASGRPAAAGQPRAAGMGGKRVLVVDDNVDAADSLGLVLRTMGAQVKVVNDGSAALEAFEAEDPSVVLLDIGMPGMSGYEVARAIRDRFPRRRAALVALTGWGQPDDRRRALEAGFDHHLVKPAEISALQKILSDPGDAA